MSSTEEIDHQSVKCWKGKLNLHKITVNSLKLSNTKAVSRSEFVVSEGISIVSFGEMNSKQSGSVNTKQALPVTQLGLHCGLRRNRFVLATLKIKKFA